MRWRAAVAACLLATSAAPYARADAAACTSAAEQGQRERAAGRFRKARDHFVACSADTCPAVVRTDCSRWIGDLAAVQPSVVIDARDAAGHDVGDVRVAMDGEVLATSLDGKPIAIDSGPHTFVFEHPGAVPVKQTLIIKEAMKDRVLPVLFASSGAPSAAPAAAVTPAPADTTPARAREHKIYPWIVVGAGGVLVVAGIVAALAGVSSVPSNCSYGTQTCTKTPAEKAEEQQTPQVSSAQFAQDTSDAGSAHGLVNLGVVGVVVGVAGVAGGLLWHFLEPTGDGHARAITPWFTAGGGGLSARGAF